MARWLLRTVGVCAAWLAVACAPSTDDASTLDEELRAPSLRPLAASELRAPITKSKIAGTHALAPAAFEAKWAASRAESPLMFFRAYPAAFHADLAQLPRGRYPGADGVCLGDAHPDNFGYLRVDDDRGGRKTIYAFNDLDDAGSCLASVDALRYFAAFRLYFPGEDADLTESVDDYADEVFGGGDKSPAAAATKTLDDGDKPDWGDVRAEVLAKYADGASFRAFPDGSLVPVDAQVRASVVAALGPSVAVHDVARRPRDAGGSGGLTRYWALATPSGGDRTVLELKETAKPAVEHGWASRRLSGAARLDELKASLWDVHVDGDYRYVTIDRATFLVRDRARKDSVDVRGKQRKAQAVYLGRLHRGRWGDASKRAVKRWLEESSAVVAARWADAFTSAR